MTLLKEIRNNIASHTPVKYLPIVTRDTSSSGIPMRAYMQRKARPNFEAGEAWPYPVKTKPVHIQTHYSHYTLPIAVMTVAAK